MKRKIALLVEISKIIINCLSVPLYFIKTFHEVAVLPGRNENGEFITGRFDYYYSVFDKFSREGILFFLWLSVAIIIVSSTISILSIVIKDNKKLMIVSHIIFGVSIVLFLSVLFVAASISYSY